MRKYINAVISLTSIGLLFYILYNQKENIKVLKSNISTMQSKLDSVYLQNELLQHENDQINHAIDEFIKKDSSNQEIVNKAMESYE